MVNDLHWYVYPKYRGNGHLSKAMKQTILPHLFQNKKKQKITINENQLGSKNFKASQKVAFSLDFVQNIDNNNYTLKKDQIQSINFTETYIEITESRIDTLVNKINYLGASLSIIQTELEMKGYFDYSKKIAGLAKEMKKKAFNLKDI